MPALAQAGTALHERRPDIPASFVTQLYARTVPEDVVRYDAVELAMLAERAFDFLVERTPGTPKIRCETVRLHETGEHKLVTVVEVLNDDMPFLVDSVMGELADRKLDVQLAAHPVFGVRREGGKLTALANADAADHARESFIHVHIETVADPAACATIVRALETVLHEVRLAVQDWRPMLERVNAIVADLKTNPPPLPVDEIAEAIQFLQWLAADNFTFLGVRNYVFDGDELKPDYDSALGIMRDPELLVLKRGDEHLEYTPEIMAFLKEPRPLIIAKANIHARVHRRVYLDYIGVKHFDAGGNLLGEQRFVGLFTSTAYTRSAHGIPYLRRKLAAIERRAGFRRQQPFRQSAGQCAGALSARRIVPGRRRHALPLRHDHSASRRASARARAGAPRPFRPLRLGSGLCAARPLRQRHPGEDGRLSGAGLYRAGVGVLSVLPGRAAGARAFHHRPLGRADARRAARHARARDRGDRPHLDRRPLRRARTEPSAGRRARLVQALPRRLFRRLSRGLFAGGGRGRRRDHRGPVGGAPARRRFPSPSGRGPALRRPEGMEPRAADSAVRARARPGKHGLRGGGRAHLPHRAARRRQRLVPRHAAHAR